MAVLEVIGIRASLRELEHRSNVFVLEARSSSRGSAADRHAFQRARRADGRVALLLYPEETAPQPVAFEIDLDAIGSIRRHLDAAEEFLGSKVGHA